MCSPSASTILAATEASARRQVATSRRSTKTISSGRQLELEEESHMAGINTPTDMTEPAAPNNSWYPAGLYNSMVAPFLSMPIRGFLWYQGCSNVGRAVQYESLFQTLILDWQSRFNKNSEVAPYPKPEPQDDSPLLMQNTESKALPFYFVQLANYLQRKDLQPQSGWAALREVQRKAQQLDGVGMMVNIDIGMANDIHPKNKQEVGRRLALLALNRTYGAKNPAQLPNSCR